MRFVSGFGSNCARDEKNLWHVRKLPKVLAKVHIRVEFLCPSCPPCVHGEAIMRSSCQFVCSSPLLRVIVGLFGHHLCTMAKTMVTWSWQIVVGRQQDIARHSLSHSVAKVWHQLNRVSEKAVSLKWPSHISVWVLRMSAYDNFLSFVVIRWCTSAARREVVERAFRARCHTHSYVGARCVRREILCMHINSLRMPMYGPYAASTFCERSARPRHGRLTLTERPQYADVGGHTICQFHDEPSACW